MAGLNDRYFLADDSLEEKVNPVVTIKAFKDGEEGEDAPELRDDIDLIAVATEELSITLRSLELFKHRVASEKGMSQTIALESLDTIPALITDERPVGFYTKFPSRTMLAAALEDASNEERSVVKKFVDFIVAMYKRVAEWLRGLINKDQVKALFSKENTALLSNAEQTLNKTKEAASKDAQLVLAYVKTVEEKINTVKAAGQNDEQVKSISPKIDQVLLFAQSLAKNETATAVRLAELNVLLTKLPYVRKYIGNVQDVNALLVTHDNTTNEVNALVHDITECIKREDYPGFKKLLAEERFAKVKDAAHNHSLAIIEFNSLPADYVAESVSRAMDVFYDQHFLNALAFGAKVTETGLQECDATVKNMEVIQTEIARLANYKFSDSEGNAKEFLEELKNFNKSIIVPTMQNLTISFSITKQLVNFIKGVEQIDTTLANRIKEKNKKLIYNEATRLGLTPDQIAKFL